MDRFVSLDLDRVPSADAGIAALSSAALYGKGVFTTVAIVGGQPFLWEKHKARLRENAARINFEFQQRLNEQLSAALTDIIQHNGRREGRARLTLFDSAGGGAWDNGLNNPPSILITTAGRSPCLRPHLSISPHIVNSTSPLAGVKSCNYLEHLLALDEAKRNGFDESIRLNERGEVTSACLANVFWCRGEKLFTPSLSTGCLAGTTREFILESLNCVEVSEGIDAVREADGVFLTSSGIGVVKAAELDGKDLRHCTHPITSILPY